MKNNPPNPKGEYEVPNRTTPPSSNPKDNPKKQK